VDADLADHQRRVTECRACPRLVAWREEVATVKRAAFDDEEYWGRPVPAFGDPQARVLVVGLAPAAHGANRTGRMFTGDRSGEFLYASLYRTGFANQPNGDRPDDGLELTDCWITAVVRCAPPANKPTVTERDTCLTWTLEELDLLPNVRVVVCLGQFGWDGALRLLQAQGVAIPKPRPKFGHGAEYDLGDVHLLGTFHPSQRNTFTGLLTPPMLDGVLARARELAGG
jgi:uracil-DNA glycosylase family 4